MIDEYETRRIRRGMFGEWWRDGKVLVAVFAGALLVTLQVLQVVVLLGH